MSLDHFALVYDSAGAISSTMNRDLTLDPLIRSTLLRRFANHSLYKWICATIAFGILGLQLMDFSTLADVVCILLSVLMFAFECTRVDRTLLKLVLKQFGTLFLLVNALLATVTGIGCRWFIAKNSSNAFAGFFSLLLLHVVASCIDAFFYPRALKIAVLVFAILNIFRMIATDIYYDWFKRDELFQDIPFFCFDTTASDQSESICRASTRQSLMAALTNIVLFLLKATAKAIFRPDRMNNITIPVKLTSAASLQVEQLELREFNSSLERHKTEERDDQHPDSSTES